MGNIWSLIVIILEEEFYIMSENKVLTAAEEVNGVPYASKFVVTFTPAA